MGFQHKTCKYSIEECKYYIGQLATLSESNEEIQYEAVTSILHYINEYKDKLIKEYIEKAPKLFKVKYMSDMGHFDGLTRGEIYDVIGVLATQIEVVNDVNSISTISKDKFIPVMEGYYNDKGDDKIS